MSITPIEIVSYAPKSQETMMQKHQEINKPQTDKQQAEVVVNTQIIKNLTQTVKMSKGENTEYRYDAKEKGRGSYGESKKQKGQKDEDEEQKPEKKGFLTSLDVRI